MKLYSLPYVQPEFDGVLRPDIANKVTRQQIKLNYSGDGIYSTPDGRFDVVDEMPEGYYVFDHSVPKSGCPDDFRDIVAITATRKAAVDRISRRLAGEGGVVKPISHHDPRAMYYNHLVDMVSNQRITAEQAGRRLDAYDDQHCRQFTERVRQQSMFPWL